MRWDDLNMGDKSRMIKLAVDSGITDLRTIRDVYNSYAEGGHLFWPGGPMNLTPYIPKVIAKGYEAVRDVLSDNPEKQKKVVEKYHENADKMPAWAHRVVYDTLKDTAFSGDMEDIPINFIYNAFLSRPNIDNTFLLDPERQKQELEKLGFRQVDTSKGYGLVNSAVKKYKDATGREVPMYQIGEDDELRENLIPLNNKSLYNAVENYREVIDAVDPETGMINESHREYLGAGMGDTAATPTRYYRDAAGNLYTKEWDFFDHGNYSRRDFNPDEQTYVTKALNTMSNTYGNLMDIAGNPFVRTTGYTRIHPDALKSALPYIVGIDNYYDRFKESSEKILRAIKNGEFDIKANGGHLFETGGPADERRQARGYSAYLSAIGQEDSPILQKRYADTYSRIEKASDFVRNYYNSEGYKRRAVASGLTDENPVETPTALPVPNMNLRDSFNRGTTARIGFIGDNGSTYLTPIPGTGISNTVDEVTVHELGHQNPNYWRLKSDPSGIVAPQQSVEILNSFKRRPANEHDAQTNESYSDLLQLRYQLQNLGIFDSTDPNAVFDRGMLKQYKDATYGGNSRYLYLHGDDNTVKAINEVAQNDVQNRFGNLAANGGRIFKAGGFTEEEFVGPPAPYIPSDSIKNYIKSTEAFRDKWYKDGNGIDTVGYGFTGDKVKGLYPNGMTREQADAYFDTLVSKFARRMQQLTPNIDKLTQNQKDALFSYFYNIGEGNYSTGSPKMQKALQDMDWDAVVQNIDAGYNDKKNPGLRKRRDYERALFEMDISRPLQPVPPAVNREPLYNPTISRFNTTIPFKNGKKEVFNPFMFNLKP